MSDPSDASQSHEMREVQVWIAGHEKICGERYAKILEEISELKMEMRGSRKQMRIERAEGDAALATRLTVVEEFNHEVKVKLAYVAGALGAAAFIGGILGPIIYHVFISKFL